MKLKRTFVGGKLNTDLDERLLPSGEYPHAENIRVANTDASDVGALENVKGNVALTNFDLTNATTIGVYTDGFNQKIYWFTTSDEKDMVVEYDMLNSVTNVLLESSKPNSVLNFDKNFLITGVVKIINGDVDKDLLVWTDDLNPPRMINIERAKTYEVDGFIEDDISLIKSPPRFAPRVHLTFSSTTLENNLENKFVSFAYRYKYLDGDYSALSSFTNYSFAPKEFDLDFQTMENNGMVNYFNALNVFFNTGDERVTDVEIVYKESNSNTLYLVERFNKKNENWADNEEKSFMFTNSKKYMALPEDELFRQYDNVPRLAKALELIGNRLVFGNYVEGYDLEDKYGQDVYINYDVSQINKELLGQEVPVTGIGGNIVSVDLSGISLTKGSRLSFEIYLKEDGETGTYNNSIGFILNRDYIDVADLAQDPDFITFVEDVMTNDFLANYVNEPPDDSSISQVIPYDIVTFDETSFNLEAPIIIYEIPDDPLDPESPTHTESRNWEFDAGTNIIFRNVGVETSLKTNRSYEVGVIYLDKHGRASTVLTDTNNTIYIPQEFSDYQNKLLVSIHNNPPYWADRYKLVVKQNKGDYHTIYANLFYEDGLFRWVKLEGANKDKVKEGDTLIVKSDLRGVVRDLVKTRVLEVSQKEKNFLEDNENPDGDEIVEEAGLYMKIKPSNFDMSFTESTSRTFEGSSSFRYPWRTWTEPLFGEIVDGEFIPYKLNAGSTVKISIGFSAFGSISYRANYEKSFRVSGDYDSIQEWFNTEVKNLGSFGKDYTWDGESNIGGNINAGHGEADEWNQFSGWGFDDDGSRFFVVPHRKGTQRRNIYANVKFEVIFTEGILIFETEAQDTGSEIFYETEQTFEIIDGKHTGNIQNQDINNPAIVEMDFFNCYTQGNGAESYRYKDAFNTNYLNIDLRPTATSVEQYKQVRRYADLTYSAPYNENNNVNGLNEFNLSRANFKDDIDKKYGYIQKLYSRDTDLVVFQEDKVSKVLYGKDLLMNADGTSNVTAIEDVLGQQVTYKGEYGISRNPESFSFDGFNVYFTDAKRGAVLRLSAEGLSEISAHGMRQYFKDRFKTAVDNKKLGGIDPYYNQYVLHGSSQPINPHINIDCSGSIIKSDFIGEQVINIDYGLLLGDAGFSYDTNGVPIRFTIEWNGETYTTGFVGDSSYNDELAEMGLPPVSSGGTGTFTFNKNQMLPTTAKITIYAPICGARFNFNGTCIISPEKQVFFIVTNAEYYNNRNIVNRFKWINDEYSSSYKSHNTVFGQGLVTHFENLTGNQGTGFIPLNNSTILMEAYASNNTQSSFQIGGRFGYLLSNTLYEPEDMADILEDFTFLEATESLYPNGDMLHKGTFVLPEDFSQNYIYLLYDYQPPVAITRDTKIRIYFDSSGSMNSTLIPLQTMKDTLLKERLLPMYDNDSELYDESVEIISQSNERTIDMLNMNGDTPDGNVIVMVFQDEAQPVYTGSTSVVCPSTSTYNTDIAVFRDRLNNFDPTYYRGVIFQVATGTTNQYLAFKTLIQSIQNGTNCYAGNNGLSNRNEFNYKYDVTPAQTPQYYLDLIVEALEELGYEL